MIRYDIKPRQLRECVDAYKSGWLDRAAKRTQKLLAKQCFAESSSIWSEIKPVFMHLQNCKCVFCERALPGERYGKGEHDLEHFRPKSEVKTWPTPAIRRERQLNYRFRTGTASSNGYFWLAYDLGNYATACKSCNSALKANFFPVAGQRSTSPRVRTIERLNALEEPYLIYPIGTADEDPEDLIGFVGIVAIPKSMDEFLHRRAQLTIDFFELNNREELWEERSLVISHLWLALKNQEYAKNQEERDNAKLMIARLTSSESPHSSCARNFLALFERDPHEAWRVYCEACNSRRPG